MIGMEGRRVDNYQCQLGLEGCTEKAEVCDHVIPVSKGGRTIIENLQAACNHCNQKKGNRANVGWLRKLFKKKE